MPYDNMFGLIAFHHHLQAILCHWMILGIRTHKATIPDGTIITIQKCGQWRKSPAFFLIHEKGFAHFFVHGRNT